MPGPASIRPMGSPESCLTSNPATKAHEGQQLAADGAQHQSQFPALRDCGPGAEDVIALPLDGAQNLQSAAAEQVQVQRQLAMNPADQWKPLLEERTRMIDLAAHQSAKLGCGDAFGNAAPLLVCAQGFFFPLFVRLGAGNATALPL